MSQLDFGSREEAAAWVRRWVALRRLWHVQASGPHPTMLLPRPAADAAAGLARYVWAL